jgi:hypothetical protein
VKKQHEMPDDREMKPASPLSAEATKALGLNVNPSLLARADELIA